MTFETLPRLSRQGKIAIKYGGGYDAFCDKYGDYFVAGYHLGGETGLLISSSSSSKEKIDAYTVRVTGKVLFWEATKVWTKDFREASSGRSFELLGYDTMETRNWKMQSKNDDVAAMQEQSALIHLRSQCLRARTLDLLDVLKFEHGQELTWDDCDRLADSGLILELIMLPMSCLRDVAHWMVNDDVI